MKIWKIDQVITSGFTHPDNPYIGINNLYRSIFAIIIAEDKDEAIKLAKEQEGDQGSYSIVDLCDVINSLELIGVEAESSIEYWLTVSNDPRWIKNLK